MPRWTRSGTRRRRGKIGADIILRTEGLSKKYKDRWAVRELNLMIPRGEVFGFLGPNGAGKTTTIRMMLGLIKPTSGSAYINGLDMHRDPMNALRYVGAIVETPAFYGYLSGRANLEVLGRISGGVNNTRIDEVLEMVGLSGRGEDKVKGYSQGMRQRLGIAQALLSNPGLVILDEPTNGLDPSGMIEIRRLIKRLAKEHGMTVFLSSHLLYEVEAVCGRVAVINSGTLVAQGPVSEFLQKETVQLEVQVSDKQRARAVLEGLGFIRSIREENGAGFIVEVEGSRVGEVNRALVTSGVDVYALTPREGSLEEFFLKLTGGASGDRGRQIERGKNA